MPRDVEDGADFIGDADDSASAFNTKIIDYRGQINAQISMSRMMITIADMTGEFNKARAAVDVLEALLIRQTSTDNGYKRALAKLIKRHKQEYSALPRPKRILWAQAYNRKFLITKLSLLIDNATRKGYTYCEEVIDEIIVRGPGGERLGLKEDEEETEEGATSDGSDTQGSADSRSQE